MTFGTFVSRETLERLRRLEDLVLKWTQRINLVSRASVNEIWERHILDSLQLSTIHGAGAQWLDLGSGGGFPGLVLAVEACETAPNRYFTLVESDTRKCAFLRSVIRELSLNASVKNERIENVPPQKADVITARALADLSTLLSFTEGHLSENGTALFMKGRTWKKEAEEAAKSWSFELVAHKSKTDEGAAILEIRDLIRV